MEQGMQNQKKSSKLPNNLDKEKRSLREYTRYTSLGYQLVAVVLAAFFIGHLLDKWISTGFPIFTLIFSVGGLATMLYLLLKGLMK
jgi:F0F1-type ATP synthase assembly protein I